MKPQHALHVIDWYLWQAVKDEGVSSFVLAGRYYAMTCREAYLDEHEMERDKRESW
jgi:hypothetical protein